MLDLKAAQRVALAEGRDLPTLPEHLLGIGSRLVAKLQSGFGAGSSENSARLAQMLPTLPEGWEIRTLEPGVAKSLLAKSDKDNDPVTVSLIEGILSPGGPRGTAVAQLAFGRKDRFVVFKLVRYPDALFIDPASLSELDALIAARPPQEQRVFLRVRGLDVAELALPDKIRARVFTADLGGQLRLWVASTKKMADGDLVPFFETLDVAAMNAAVRDREPGLGEVPVLVVVSELDAEARAAYEADRAARAHDRETALQETRAALATRLAPAADQDGGADRLTGCTTSDTGVTLCLSGG
jgi:hypothetical protein